jgi:hypothetical protein
MVARCIEESCARKSVRGPSSATIFSLRKSANAAGLTKGSGFNAPRVLGSSHNFKHGPVMGEMVAEAFLGLKAPPTEMGLRRRLKIGSSWWKWNVVRSRLATVKVDWNVAKRWFTRQIKRGSRGDTGAVDKD